MFRSWDSRCLGCNTKAGDVDYGVCQDNGMPAQMDPSFITPLWIILFWKSLVIVMA